MMQARVLTWNLQWAAPSSPQIGGIQSRIASEDADVAVLTEVDLHTVTGWAHILEPGPHPAVREPNRRKVAVVSRWPMRLVDNVGSERLPPRNFVAADVDTPDGVLRVIGVVIRWNQKAEFIDALPDALRATVAAHTVVAGDFNLALPGGPLSRRLLEVFGTFGIGVVTGGHHAALDGERPLIDHIGVTEDLEPSDCSVWPRRISTFNDGTKELTDHAGCAITVSS